MTNIDFVTQKWHEVVETKNLDLLDDLLADDATLVSPVVHTPQVGKKITKKYLVAAMHVLPTTRLNTFVNSKTIRRWYLSLKL
jgi:hypothetical protein